MPRPKKAELSPQVGTVNLGRKRGNPDFVSSSFYVPKQVNIRFDRALLTLKANGFDVDRSDILSVLMDRFSVAVDAAEQQGGDLDLEAILATASDGSVQDSADVSVLKRVMQESVDALKEMQKTAAEDLAGLQASTVNLQQQVDELRSSSQQG